jgi:hypothetical protein
VEIKSNDLQRGKANDEIEKLPHSSTPRYPVNSPHAFMAFLLRAFRNEKTNTKKSVRKSFQRGEFPFSLLSLSLSPSFVGIALCL